ncbi:uncharacterized protein LOC107635796 [Arachis ipaensis]|uniref:uncharacterized protein LOC107635796 n=1 Tax=Arachis ipaensis TaxID=130454 RepID=UPI0007AF64D9|nr:uncharacterized protein LOC107635796 [Arachis ipaensis]XP_025644997.1 uncharacterized protein LOC112740549 [Arachis hypogaea]
MVLKPNWIGRFNRNNRNRLPKITQKPVEESPLFAVASPPPSSSQPTAIATASRSHSSNDVDHRNHHRVLFRCGARLLFRRRYSPPMEQSQSNHSHKIMLFKILKLDYARLSTNFEKCLGLGLARWIIDARISFNAIQSSYFQPALDGVAAIGPGFKGPSYDEMRVHLLADLKKECQLLVEGYRSSWKSTGCTLMADGWTDQRQRTLNNFLVYYPAGMSFVKSVDASDMIKTVDTLFKLFAEVIEWVGSSNIVHVVTDNATNYVSAGKLIHEKYPNIFWSPCAVHCINLILKDIASIPHIADIASHASKVTAIYDHKEDLQSLVVDKYFTSHKLFKSVNGKMVSSIILDSKFWEDCITTVMLVGPLIKLLRLVDADEKLSLGIVYEGMQRVKIAIKTMFRNRKFAYTPYTSILKMRWDKHLKRDLHAAAYFLNPDFFYSEGFVEKPNILKSLLDLFDIETLCDDSVAAMQEIQFY